MTFAHCDVTDFKSAVEAFKIAVASSPSKTLDIAALIAGVVGEGGSLVDQVVKAQADSGAGRGEPPKPRHPAVDVNLLGVYDCAYLALYYMSLKSEVTGEGAVQEKGDGAKTKSLILISSTAAYTDIPMFSDYQASKCEFSPFLQPSNAGNTSIPRFPFPARGLTRIKPQSASVASSVAFAMQHRRSTSA